MMAPEYGEILKDAAARYKIPSADLEKLMGRSRQTVWRATEPDKASLKGAYDLRNALVVLTKEDLPPPVVPIVIADDYRWYKLGQRLQNADFERFKGVLAEIEKIVDAIAQDQSGMSNLASLGHPSASEVDDK